VNTAFESGRSPGPRADCGIPLDSQYFDESGVATVPPPGGEVVLARFELSPQYCGALEYFSQFTDLHARDLSRIETPGLQWTLRSNNRPLYPYMRLKSIINPWGYGGFPILLRLEENAAVEIVVRAVGKTSFSDGAAIRQVGGRIMGRYWYNPGYGDGRRRGC
jgi:hypothetical protein